MSQRQQAELETVVEKVRARPGPKKVSFYPKARDARRLPDPYTIRTRLRQTPRLLAKRALHVYGDSPAGHSVQDGARFPLTSIKEIIRVEEDTGSA